MTIPLTVNTSENIPIVNDVSHKILIAGPGKVGTCSLQDSMRTCGYLHYGDGHTNLEDLINNKDDSVFQSHDSQNISDICNKLLKNTDDKIFVFLGARDMMRREISAFFQVCVDWNWKKDSKVNHKYNLQDLYHQFNKFSRSNVELSKWLNDFCDKMGIDSDDMIVYSKVVQKQGFHFVEKNDRLSFIFYRLENLNSIWDKIVFYNKLNRLQGSFLLNSNKNTDKTTDVIYKDFLSNYKPPKDIIDSVYSYDLNQFYSDEYIQEQKDYWSNK